MKKAHFLGLVSILFCIISILVFPMNLNATLITESYDGKTVIRDTNTGLRWLHWGTIVGQSYDTVKSWTAPGGAYEDFRYANQTELGVLWASLGSPGPYDGSWWSSTYTIATNFMDIFGRTQLGDNTRAFIEPLHAPGSIYVGAVSAAQGQGSGGAMNDHETYSTVAVYSDFGHALIVIPEPITVVLLGLGGLMIRRRR